MLGPAKDAVVAAESPKLPIQRLAFCISMRHGLRNDIIVD